MEDQSQTDWVTIYVNRNLNLDIWPLLLIFGKLRLSINQSTLFAEDSSQMSIIQEHIQGGPKSKATHSWP